MDKEKPYIVNGQRVTLEEYRKTKYEDLRVRVPIGRKAGIQAHAEKQGESLNAFVTRAIDAAMEMDNKLTDDEAHSKFHEWLVAAGPEDKQLFNTIIEYQDDYFKDMTFQTDSITMHDYLYYKIADENGVFQSPGADAIPELSSITNFCYRFYVRQLPKTIDGRINLKERIIEISPEAINNPAVIMHEMIHAYEDALSVVSNLYRDILFMCLHKQLRSKIDNLDDLVLSHSHIFEAEDTYRRGGSHDILFFLKSLDLDLQLGYPLGTVCGYGRDEMMTQLNPTISAVMETDNLPELQKG